MEGGRDAIEGAKSVLRTLKELLEDGLISKQEFEEQKKKEVQGALEHARKGAMATVTPEATSTGQSTRLAEVARQEGEGRSSKKEVEVVARSEARPNVRRDDRGGGVSDEGKRRREEYERHRREEEREVIGGREKRRRERSRGSWDDVGRVEVWRLPKTINAGGVKEMFRGVGTVTEAVVHTQDPKDPKARATVTFADSSQAERAVRKMHGKLIEGIGNIGVKWIAPENGGVRRSPSPPKKPSGRSPTKERHSYAPAGPPSRNDSRYDWGGYSWYDYDPRDPRSDSRDPRRDLRFSRDPRYDWRKDSRYR